MGQEGLQFAIQSAIRQAFGDRHEYVTVEHLLYALLFQEEAAECASARAELAAAKTDAEFDRALMKVDILCNG